MHLGKLLRGAGGWALVAIAIIAALAVLLADLGRVTAALAAFPHRLIPLILLFVSFNYLLRFAKWEYFLRRLGLQLPIRGSLWVFFASFVMVLSPGKLGEVVKSLLLRNRYDIPVARTAPIVLAERLTDLLGLMCLAAWGFSRFAWGGKTLMAGGALMLVGLIAATRPAFWRLLDRAAGRLFPGKPALRNTLRALEESTRTLLTLPALLVTVPLSAFSWAWEGAALYVIFGGLGVVRPELFALSLFAHAFGSITGALSFLPGGLLVTEGALSLFFVSMGIAGDIAVTATLLIRAVTLWFAILLGLCVFAAGARADDLRIDRPAAA
ncbi:MAG TPA: lysylphosphatidylglycerol synthase transmembrane domain-containing protein [Candidatus Ozemobacteraceae bacterium]|nr:lysylphosphatidylglycerol synthase transmembrane domain-containing protein [Candidatus Ozemobacteraceae bacterium]